MTYHRSSRSQNLQQSSPSMAKLRLKLAQVASRHDQLKLSFNNLKSQIETGLFEAEDVLCSLAVPLVKIVG
nr:cingulin like [Tanacetum cinerariifolium]